MEQATVEEDKKIIPVGCIKACFQGYVGMDRCGYCDGVGSQLVIPSGFRFPNTEKGYEEALKKLREKE